MNTTPVGDPAAAPIRGIAHKTKDGAFWHIDASPKTEASYVRTKCGRRLGRWNLLAPRTVSSLSVDDVCVGCLRKGAK